MKRVTLVQLDDQSIVMEISQHDQLNGSTIRRTQVVKNIDEELPEFLNEFFDPDCELT